MSVICKLLLLLVLILVIVVCFKLVDIVVLVVDVVVLVIIEQVVILVVDVVVVVLVVEVIKIVLGIYKLDLSYIDVLVQWSYFGFFNLSVYFGNVEGILVYNVEDVIKFIVEVKLLLSGLNSFIVKFDEYLKSVDFFDVVKFVDVIFKSIKVEVVGINKLIVIGDLIIKGIIKLVILDVIVNGGGEYLMVKVLVVGFDVIIILKCSDFGVGVYVLNVSDEVKICIIIEVIGEKLVV